MWDEKDYFGRWVQGVCAVVLGAVAVGGIIFIVLAGNTLTLLRSGIVAATLGCIGVGWRCARYAITGRNNINRDDF